MFEDFKTDGYRRDLEDTGYLSKFATPSNLYCTGDIDPTNMGEPIGMIDVIKNENQFRLSSCAGNSGSTILESCLWQQSKGSVNVQLSRMMAYINGQRKSDITGDNGATLAGVLQGFKEYGCCLEELAQYTGTYYTKFSQEAIDEAKNRSLRSWSQVTNVDQVYEGLAKRVGGLFLGIAWTSDCNNPISNCIEHYSAQRCGCHAIAILDWCDKRDRKHRPYLRLFNSWGLQYADRGTVQVAPDALQSMLDSPLTSAYFLTEMEFVQPRFKFEGSEWL